MGERRAGVVNSLCSCDRPRAGILLPGQTLRFHSYMTLPGPCVLRPGARPSNDCVPNVFGMPHVGPSVIRPEANGPAKGVVLSRSGYCPRRARTYGTVRRINLVSDHSVQPAT